MDEGGKKEKVTRRKRRVEGSATPPRKEFLLRLEASTVERMNQMLDGQPFSRNQYIERLIEFDLSYRERLMSLNHKPSDPQT
jgi:hypothetical protein